MLSVLKNDSANDENLTSQPFNNFYERIEETVKLMKKAEKETGEKKVYLAMMDGQESLWKQVKRLKETYPEGQWVEILDLMHVNSYLWDAACAVVRPVKAGVFSRRQTYQGKS
jgi:ribulose 1,5-bisphosphate carboxylase large subunit-like protein